MTFKAMRKRNPMLAENGSRKTLRTGLLRRLQWAQHDQATTALGRKELTVLL